MTKKNKDTKAEEVTPLPTRKEKEYELDALLSAEEEANYDRIKKQGKSDEIDNEIVDVAKNIYRKGKKAVGKIVEGAKKMMSGDKIEKAGKDMASGITTKMFTKGVAKAIEDTSGDKE